MELDMRDSLVHGMTRKGGIMFPPVNMCMDVETLELLLIHMAGVTWIGTETHLMVREADGATVSPKRTYAIPVQ